MKRAEIIWEVSELELIFYKENPMENERKSKIRGFIFLVCTDFSIENVGAGSEIFSNNFCTFHAVSRKVISRFSKFWILRKRMTPTFNVRLVPLQSVRTLPIGKLFKTIDEKCQTMLALTHPFALVFTCSPRRF